MLVGRDKRFSLSTSDRNGRFGNSCHFRIKAIKKKLKLFLVQNVNANGIGFIRTASVNSKTGGVAGVDVTIEVGSLSIGGVNV